MLVCKFCQKECKSNKSLVQHERCCASNPTRNYKNGMTGKTAWNKGKTKDSDASLAQQSATLAKRFADGQLKLAGIATQEWRQSEAGKAVDAKAGGYRENAGISKKFKVVDSFGNEVTLQSSYELECSVILNELGFKWLRPKALKYDGRNYFADFYLPDYDIWLDPKNEHKAKLDEEKINKVIEQNKVKLYVLLQHQITKEYIGRLAEMD